MCRYLPRTTLHFDTSVETAWCSLNFHTIFLSSMCVLILLCVGTRGSRCVSGPCPSEVCPSLNGRFASHRSSRQDSGGDSRTVENDHTLPFTLSSLSFGLFSMNRCKMLSLEKWSFSLFQFYKYETNDCGYESVQRTFFFFCNRTLFCIILFCTWSRLNVSC